MKNGIKLIAAIGGGAGFMALIALLLLILPPVSRAEHLKGESPNIEQQENAAQPGNPYIVALTYHHIVPQITPEWEGNRSVITVAEFTEQMNYLKQNGYATVTLDEAVRFLTGQGSIPPKAVLITFDDGYESNYTYAFPVLKEHQFKAAIFPIARLIRDGSEVGAAQALSHLSWGQIREMTESGLVDFGCHTFNLHHKVNGRPVLLQVWPEAVARDFRQVQNVFSQNRIKLFPALAYPYGAYSNSVLWNAVGADFWLGFTTRPGVIHNNSNRLLLPRNTVYPGMKPQDFKRILTEVPSPS